MNLSDIAHFRRLVEGGVIPNHMEILDLLNTLTYWNRRQARFTMKLKLANIPTEFKRKPKDNGSLGSFAEMKKYKQRIKRNGRPLNTIEITEVLNTIRYCVRRSSRLQQRCKLHNLD